MAGPVNSGWIIDFGESITIPVNQWSRVSYTLQVDSFGDTNLGVTGTTDLINRTDENGDPISPNFYPLKDFEGNVLSTVGALGLILLAPYALRAIKIANQGTSETAGGRLMQQGDI